ncbi:hypothetical protein AVEN_192819-1 [Araneus ventricosus]|uniref:Uncharacterized protein n=1 Tax=Araneus ventricosus TaxID=182803 RepID=A0A4Y2SR24_ARAVE|nr:hypothetical protein AVEN_206825-1 [Araneus ventricosus]GBN90205.1 hypothetical protein AVEN_47720-1 [Araneus ventricosus]GBN90734.1 hypothetical protein AVEN_168521-1 [Araneus ventricosus]GBN90790.1 hypothetical protein AVEN_192819-1 [Araneus ventricosus]
MQSRKHHLTYSLKGSILVPPVLLGDVPFPVVNVRKSDVSLPNRGYQNRPVNLQEVFAPQKDLLLESQPESSNFFFIRFALLGAIFRFFLRMLKLFRRYSPNSVLASESSNP